MRSSILKLAAVALVVLGAGSFGYVELYGAPRAALEQDIRSLERGIEQYKQALRRQQGDKARLEAITETTLGATQAEIEHRLRSSLGEIARHCGLEQVVPNSGTPQAVFSPAARSEPRIGGDFGRMLKDHPDFYVVQGSLTGVGSLDAVLATLATVREQAWAHRVGAVTIKPAGPDRGAFELRIDSIATLMMPDIVDADAEPPGWTALTERDRQAWAGVTAKNVFRRPDPEPEPEPMRVVAAPAPTVEAAPAYDLWKLTALPGGTSGSLAGMVNVSTGEQKFLEVGDSVLDAQLAGVERFSAIFELAGRRCEVQIGQTLAERREIP